MHRRTYDRQCRNAYTEPQKTKQSHCSDYCEKYQTEKQWRTEEGVMAGGLGPLPLAYDLRNKRVRMRQNMVFSI